MDRFSRWDLFGDEYEVADRRVRNLAYQNGKPYWVVHLDCARKYFSVTYIKLLIDLMANAGLNQLELHFSENEGLRFGLDDMTVYTDDGTSYDLTPCLSSAYLTESEMDEIIVHAYENGIDIVPSLDMPGHMANILTNFPEFKYAADTGGRTLDATNPTACKFALAVVDKYAAYFESRGCKFWNIGTDEIGGNWSGAYEAETISDFATLVSDIAGSVIRRGMTPRIFNGLILFNNDYTLLMDKRIQILYWNNGHGVNPSVLIRNGYTVINANEEWYYILGKNHREDDKTFLNTDTLLTKFYGETVAKDQAGAMFCIWCDSAGIHGNDDGKTVIEEVTEIIAGFGEGRAKCMDALDYPVLC